MKIFRRYLSGYCNVHTQLANHLRDRTLEVLRENERQKAALTSPDEVRERGRRVREVFLESLGGLPPRDTPLNARTVSIVARPGYHIEKIIFESQPRVYVTGLLYIPDRMELPAPAVLFVCGHALEAKGAPEYQRVCHDLARNGMVAFAIDPTGQGERITTLDPETRAMSHGWGTSEHSYQGQGSILVGMSIARYFLHDALRAVDYLQERPEVDPGRIGITGNSGGGTQTTLVCMSGDERIKAAVPCTYVTSREHYYQTGQPQDAEQLQFGMTANGIDFDDMFYPFAPRPLLIGAVRSDFFSPEGTHLTWERLRRAYRLFGEEDKAGLAWAPGRHAYHAELRQAAVNWFRKHLLRAEPNFQTVPDEEIEILPDADLWCTRKGHVLTEFPDGRTPHHLNLEALPSRPRPASPDAFRRAVAEGLGVSARLDARVDMFPRVLEEQNAEGLRVESIDFISEPGIRVTGALVYPDAEAPSAATLFLAEGGTERIDDHLPKVREEAEQGRAVFVFDVRGTGAVEADPINAYGTDYPSLYYNTEGVLAFAAYCLGDSLLGMRVFDTLRAAEYLRRERGFTRIALRAEGLAPALWGYLAAALDPDVAEVRIDGLIESYEALVRTPLYRRDIGPALIAHGLLRRFDLPELRSLFEGRALEVTTVSLEEA